MKSLPDILDEIEVRNILMTSFNRGSTLVSRDVPALVKALRRAMKFIHDVDIGCYDIPEQVEDEVASILNREA